MRTTVEVRSSGPGPRKTFLAPPWPAGKQAGLAMYWSEAMAERWTRRGLDRRGRMRTVVDGVAIIIRRSE